MKTGQLTMAHLGKRVTIGNDEGGFISGRFSSMELSWAEPYMGEVTVASGLRITVGGWPIVVGMETEIEVIDV